MPRQPRQFIDGGYYHLIARGNNRRYIFTSDEDFKIFKSLLKISKERYSWRLYHYCLMSNHIHLLVQMAKGDDLPKMMQFILQQYSRYYRKKTDYIGYLWQGRYKSPFINNESYLLECGRYVERNPVRAGLVPDPGSYPWSSYSHYALGEKDFLLDDDPYFKSMGVNEEERRTHYKDFVKIDRPHDRLVDKTLLESYF